MAFDLHLLASLARRSVSVVGQDAALAVATLLALVAWGVPPLDFVIGHTLTGHPTLLNVERTS